MPFTVYTVFFGFHANDSLNSRIFKLLRYLLINLITSPFMQ